MVYEIRSTCLLLQKEQKKYQFVHQHMPRTPTLVKAEQVDGAAGAAEQAALGWRATSLLYLHAWSGRRDPEHLDPRARAAADAAKQATPGCPCGELAVLARVVWEVGSGAPGPAGTCRSGRGETGDAGLPARRACCTCATDLGWDTEYLDPLASKPASRSAAMARFRWGRVLSSLSWTPSGGDHCAASHAQQFAIAVPRFSSARRPTTYDMSSKKTRKKEMTVVLLTTKTKKQQTKPSAFSTGMHKEFRKMANAVKNHVTGNYYTPDLTKPALARHSIYRSLQVAKYSVKKKPPFL